MPVPDRVAAAACGSAAHTPAPTTAPAATTAAPAPPPVPASPCDDVALADMKTMAHSNAGTAKVVGATEYDTMLRPVYVQACAEDGWTAEQIACWDDAGPDQIAPDVRCPPLLSSDQRDKLHARIDAGAREEESQDAGGTYDPTGIAACDAYLRDLHAFLGCAALSAKDRADTTAAVETMARTWHRARDARISDRVHHALEAACTRGVPLLADASRALGCAAGQSAGAPSPSASASP